MGPAGPGSHCWRSTWLSILDRSLDNERRLLAGHLCFPRIEQARQLGDFLRVMVGEILALAGVSLQVEEQLDGAIADVLPAPFADRFLLAVLAVDTPEEAPLPGRCL